MTAHIDSRFGGFHVVKIIEINQTWLETHFAPWEHYVSWQGEWEWPIHTSTVIQGVDVETELAKDTFQIHSSIISAPPLVWQFGNNSFILLWLE